LQYNARRLRYFLSDDSNDVINSRYYCKGQIYIILFLVVEENAKLLSTRPRYLGILRLHRTRILTYSGISVIYYKHVLRINRR
jgi:hypothetical protein